MALGCYQCCSSVAQPFLRNVEVEESKRLQGIANAVEEYLTIKSLPPIPGYIGASELEMPEPLEWLLMIEEQRDIYGDIPPVNGGLLDQPYHFTQDLMWANIGRKRWRQKQQKSKEQSQNADTSVGMDKTTLKTTWLPR